MKVKTMWETRAASIFPNEKGTAILKKEVLEYFPVGPEVFQTLYFLGSLTLSGGLKLLRLHKNHRNMISFIHICPSPNYRSLFFLEVCQEDFLIPCSCLPQGC